jgi:hypothetical protein
VDRHLAALSWDRTWARTDAAIESWLADEMSRRFPAQAARHTA